MNKLAEAFEPKAQTDGVEVSVPVDRTAEQTVKILAIDVNYPDPTHLSQILRDVAKWSGFAFVMEPTTNVRLQIFAPLKLPPHQAYELFLASLSVVGLRAVQIGKVVKIVPVTLVVSA